MSPGARAPLGVLLCQLGTPKSPDMFGVARFLGEFLSDRRVVPLPPFFWLPLLWSVVIPLRARRVARAYREIWREKGSPLAAEGQNLARGLASRLRFPVALAMRYGKPGFAEAMKSLLGVETLVVLPLFPQYASSTAGAAWDGLVRELGKTHLLPHVLFIRDYHKAPAYIAAMAESIKRHWREKGRGGVLVFSFHGLPQKAIEAGEPYLEQCLATSRLIAAQLDLAEDEWRIAFQSRFGKGKWLKPDLLEVLETLGQEKQVDVATPGFSADCLETLEEIGVRAKRFFENLCGGRLELIPALGDQPLHIEAIAAVVNGALAAP